MSFKPLSRTKEILPPFPLWNEKSSKEPKIHTLSFCSGNDLLKMAQVCKRLSSLISQPEVWQNFAKKRGITLILSPDLSSQKQVFEFVKIFTSLFPEIVVKKKKKTKNAFEERWQAISRFVRRNPNKLLEKIENTSRKDKKELFALMEASPPNIQFIKAYLKKVSDNWEYLVERGFPSSEEEMLTIFELVHEMYETFGVEYYSKQLVEKIKKVRGEDFQFPEAVIKKALEPHMFTDNFRQQTFEIRFSKTARLMITKENATSNLFQHALDHFSAENFYKICTHFLSVGYKFNREDLQKFLAKKWVGGKEFIGTEKLGKLFDQIVKTVNFPAKPEDLEWAIKPASYSSYSYSYKEFSPKVIQKILSLMENPPSTEMFQSALSRYFSPKIVHIFLERGYQITSSDFKFVIDKLTEQRKEKKLPWSSDISDPDPEILSQFLAQDSFKRIGHIFDTDREKIYLGGKFKPSREDFQYMLKKRPHYFFIEKILKNGYQVNSEDFKKAIAHADVSDIRALLKGDPYKNYPEDAYMPTQEDFQYALKKNVSWCTIEELISRGYKVTSDDFICALRNKCDAKTVSVLLNEGYIKKMHYSREILSFEHKNGGFEPSEDDVKYAQALNCSKEIIDLMKERMKKE